MSHELEMVDGKASMAWAGEVPWHGLGKEVPSDLTPQQMLEAAGLDWEVTKVPVTASLDGNKVNGLDYQALVRKSDNKFLSMVSDKWEPLQNIEAFNFFNDFIAAGEMEMNTAGSLFGGKHVWALAKINEGFELFGGDKVEGFLLFSNPHQFGKSIDIRFTPVRVVCNNTISLALNGKAKQGLRINHRKAFDADAAKEMLGLASGKLQEYKERAEYLGKKRAKHEDVVDYFKRIFPALSKDENAISRNAERLLEILDEQPGTEYAPGSWWQAFNAVTFFTNHEQGRSQDNRLDSMWYGKNAERNIDALNLAVEMA